MNWQMGAWSSGDIMKIYFLNCQDKPRLSYKKNKHTADCTQFHQKCQFHWIWLFPLNHVDNADILSELISSFDSLLINTNFWEDQDFHEFHKSYHIQDNILKMLTQNGRWFWSLIILCPSEKWSWATWRRMPTYTDHQWTLTKLRSSLYLPTGNDLWGTEILLSNITLRWTNRTATKNFQFSKIQHNLLPLLVNNIWATWLAKGVHFFTHISVSTPGPLLKDCCLGICS